MPTTGISTPSFQLVESGRPRDATYIYAGVGEVNAQIPVRRGFYYVFINSLLDPPSKSIIASGIVYEPGIYLPLPVLQTVDSDTISCLVNWNIGGVEWFFDIS